MIRKNTTVNVTNVNVINHILANDPSMTAWGWAVIDWQGNIVDRGCIKTAGVPKKKRRIRKGDDTVRRVNELNQQLLLVIKKYNVNYLLSELPHGSQNASAAVMIGICTGILQTIADCFEIGVEWFSEGDSKKCALGKLSAEKSEMILTMKQLYTLQWPGIKYQDEAIADAIAIYHVASKESSTLRLFKK
jgi:Holliday junction resolvasome RuvABC endonuclease subunit